MERVWSMILAMTLWQAWEANGELQLFVTHAPSIIKGNPFYVDMAIHSTPEISQDCTLTLTSNFGAPFYSGSTQNISIEPAQKTARATFMIPGDVTGSSANVNLNCGKLNLASRVSEVRDPSSSTIVQTDKGKYKPGQEILYRVLNVDSMLKPQYDTTEVIITDPEGNKIWRKVSDETEEERGILDGSYTLSNEAQTGLYKITVYSQSSKKESIIEVEKYVLPKTYVEIKLDPANVALTPDSTAVNLKGIVTGLYTNGQFVQGSMVLLIDGKLKLNVTQFTGTYKVDIALEVGDRKEISPKKVMKITAIVYEGFTNNPANVSQSFTVYPCPFAAMPVTPLPYYSKKNGTYTFKVALTNFLGGPLTNWIGTEDSKNIANYDVYYEYRPGDKRNAFSKTVIENPITVTVNVEEGMELSDKVLDVWFAYTPTPKGYDSERVPVPVRTMTSHSGNSITVGLMDSLNKDEACFKISPWVNGDKYFYQIVGTSSQSQMMECTQATHCFALTEDHSPKFEVIVYSIHSYSLNGESETPEILVNKVIGMHSSPSDEISMTVTPPLVQPGDSVEIIVTTPTTRTGVSFVGISAVDLSSLLLAPGHRVSESKLMQVRALDRLFESGRQKGDGGEMPGIMPMIFFRGFMPYEPTITPKNILTEAGLSLTPTNQLTFYGGFSFLPVPAFDPDRLAIANGGDFAAMLPPVNEGGEAALEKVGDAGDSEVDQERTDFPETWLWELVEINGGGETRVTRPVPDSITKWVIDAFLLHRQQGLQALPTVELTVNKDVFTRMDLPYSIVRTEEFMLKALVFNYQVTDIEVDVELIGTDEFLILDQSMSAKRLTIAAGTTNMIEVPIKGTKIGNIKLEVVVKQANSETVLDKEIRELPVEPEGRRVETSIATTFDVPDDNGELTFNIQDIIDTENLVDGSLKVYARITGDIMGAYWPGMESDLRMPVGCGEQNIIIMTPSLFVGKYLKHLNKLDYETRVKVEKFCQIGYTRELNYRHDNDGSFSAFGNSDPSGSTWLTAYVLKVFANLAKEGFADGILQLPVLHKAFTFLQSKTTTRGPEYFVEDGRVIHTEMTGGTTNNKNAFTSFVLIAIQDYYNYLVFSGASNAEKQTVMQLIDSATEWLYTQYNDSSSSTSSYSKALMAYAFAGSADILDDSSARYRNAADDLTKDVSIDDQKTGSSRSKRDVMPSRKTTSSQVEINGYHLLTFVTLSRVFGNRQNEFRQRAQQIITWLTEQRNGNGQYRSTQDTAVAIQAMAEFAVQFPGTSNVALSVKVNTASAPIQLNNDNYYTLFEQQVDLTSSENEVKMMLSGTSGKAVITVMAIYHVSSNAVESTLDGTIENGVTEAGKKYINVGIISKSTGPYGMVTCGLNLPSGFEVDDVMPENKENGFARVELNEQKNHVDIYYQSDNFSEKKTVRVYYTEQYVVDNRQPSALTIRDYYNPDNNVEIFYETRTDGNVTLGASGVTVNLVLFSFALVAILLHTFSH